uniref:MucB/RseB N-terminal domain-containing protein n=1 Tax=Candidatus Caldatribacterium californiense TaxID=1454726 RepID=A0A7V3YGJ8_9BACT
MRFLLPFVFFLVFVFPGFAQVLSPEEARSVVDRVLEASLARDYWGVWRLRDFAKGKEHFVEVLFLKGVGFAWKMLGEEEIVHMRFGHSRYVVNLKSGEVESVYPLLDFPFVPFEREDLPLLLENYVFDLREDELALISRWTGKVVRSIVFGDGGEMIGQRMYAPWGELLAEWRMLYRDASPDFPWIAQVTRLLELWSARVSGAGSPEEKVSGPSPFPLPGFVPPGFQLRRAYLLRDDGKKFYGFVYSDGLRSFILFQSAYPFRVSESSTPRYLQLVQEGGMVRVAAEKGGFYFLLIGGLDPRVGQEIMQSLLQEGGRE